MRKSIRNLLPPLISLVIVMLGNGFFNTFVSLRISVEGYSSWIIGILNASYYAGLMLGSINIEKFLNRIGHIRTFAIFASINSLVIVLQGIIIGPLIWTIFRFLIGVCTSGFFIVIESWLLLSTGVKNRGRVLSLYMLTLYMAQGFGQFILNLSPLTSLLPFAFTVILSSLSIIPVCMMKSSGPLLLDSSITNIFQIFKKAPLGIIGCFISGMIMSTFYGLVPIFAKEIGLSILQISQIMGLTILGGLALQWPIGHLSDIFNRRKVLLGVCFFLMVLTFFIFYMHSVHYYLLLSLMILFGGISFTLYPTSISYTCDYFSDKNIVGITCALLIMFGVGSIIGPLISPIFMSILGPSGIFVFMSALCAIYMVIGMVRALHSKPLNEEEQSDYLPLPRATSLAFYLDPRCDLEAEEDFEEIEGTRYPFEEEDEDEDEDD